MSEYSYEKDFEDWLKEGGIEDEITKDEKEFLQTLPEREKVVNDLLEKWEKATTELTKAADELSIPLCVNFGGVSFRYIPRTKKVVELEELSRVKEFLNECHEWRFDGYGWANSYNR
jgi:hypothetical protein